MNLRYQCVYTGLISHNDLGGIKCDMPKVQRGMGPSEYWNGSMALMKASEMARYNTAQF